MPSTRSSTVKIRGLRPVGLKATVEVATTSSNGIERASPLSKPKKNNRKKNNKPANGSPNLELEGAKEKAAPKEEYYLDETGNVVEYEVESVLLHIAIPQTATATMEDSSKRNVPDQNMYLIKWVGYDEATWEPAEALVNCPQRLAACDITQKQFADWLDGKPSPDHLKSIFVWLGIVYKKIDFNRLLIMQGVPLWEISRLIEEAMALQENEEAIGEIISKKYKLARYYFLQIATNYLLTSSPMDTASPTRFHRLELLLKYLFHSDDLWSCLLTKMRHLGTFTQEQITQVANYWNVQVGRGRPSKSSPTLKKI